MPNLQNIESPLLIIGAGRTASSYVIDRLFHGRHDFYGVIENYIYLDVFKALTEGWFAGDWKWVCDNEERDRRIIKMLREAYCTLFPSEQPHWVMKCIWEVHRIALLDQLFPKAKYLHLIRDPRTNLPSMMEFIQWKFDRACTKYIESNNLALQYQQFQGRYLRVRQEDFIDRTEETWRRVTDFLGVEPLPVDWDKYINLSPSQQDKTREKRADSSMRWEELPAQIQQMALDFGYSPDGENCSKNDNKTIAYATPSGAVNASPELKLTIPDGKENKQNGQGVHSLVHRIIRRWKKYLGV